MSSVGKASVADWIDDTSVASSDSRVLSTAIVLVVV
jgi:hypothetical protein